MSREEIKVITWPITRERYRQVLMKMTRQWKKIQRLENVNRQLVEYINKLHDELKCKK